jgi:hypothetical protein
MEPLRTIIPRKVDDLAKWWLKTRNDPLIKEKCKLWETDITRWGFYDENNEKGYARMLKAGTPIEQMIALAKDNGDYLGKKVVHGNIALNEGLQAIGEIIAGISAPTMWTSAAAYIGVGDSSTAENATQTALQAATNYAYATMTATYPKRTNQTVSWKSDFAAGTASWAWNETTVINGNGTGTNLNRKVGTWGTKGANDVYSMQHDITLS